MIYAMPPSDDSLSQGDIIRDCPVIEVEGANLSEMDNIRTDVKVIVLTQACDLAQAKSNRVVVAVVYRAQKLVDKGILKAVTIRDQVRAHRVYGWYFLPASSELDESLVDFRDLHTLPRALLDSLIAAGQRVCRLTTPYREHMAQHFSTTYSRIALPESYDTEA